MQNSKKRLTARKTATIATLTAFALLSFMLENLLPSLPVPGARIGISNVFALLCLLLYGPIESGILVLVKTGLGAVFAGNVSAIAFSLPAGLISLLLSWLLLYKTDKVSLIAVSVVSAVVHNGVQLLVYAMMTTTAVFAYAPVLLAFGLASGLIVGAIVFFVIKTVPLFMWTGERVTEVKNEEDPREIF